jgi:hypothetical protein
MATLIFLTTFFTIIILVIRIIIKTVRHKSVLTSVRLLAIVFLTYGVLWVISYFISGNKAISLGTDICFDDWCVTVTKIERQPAIGNEKAKGQFIILHIKMSNRAKGIAQKPSEPRVHIIDEQRHLWTFSKQGQNAIENLKGKQIPIDQKLELRQSLETLLVFDIPQDAKNCNVLIEEGPPFITKLLLQEDNKVFKIQ